LIEALQHEPTGTERRIFRFTSPWIDLLDRKAKVWEEAAAAGRIDRGFDREVYDTCMRVFSSVALLVGNLQDEGLLPAGQTSFLWQAFVQRLERLAKAHREVSSAFETQLGNSELEQRRASRTEVGTELKELANSIGA
jgi:hypothetical protein